MGAEKTLPEVDKTLPLKPSLSSTWGVPEGSQSVPNFTHPSIQVEESPNTSSGSRLIRQSSPAVPRAGGYNVRFDDQIDKIERDLASRRSTTVPASELSSASTNVAQHVPSLPNSSTDSRKKEQT